MGSVGLRCVCNACCEIEVCCPEIEVLSTAFIHILHLKLPLQTVRAHFHCRLVVTVCRMHTGETKIRVLEG